MFAEDRERERRERRERERRERDREASEKDTTDTPKDAKEQVKEHEAIKVILGSKLEVIKWCTQKIVILQEQL